MFSVSVILLLRCFGVMSMMIPMNELSHVAELSLAGVV